MLVVLEGLDGAGKSTQTKKLRNYLESTCPHVEYIHFPRYDAPVYGELIAKFLRGELGANNSVHPQLVALLFAQDRALAAEEMRKTLNSGGTVLLDRYVYSNIAYQCAKLDSRAESEELRKWIINTEYGVFKLPRPDLNIFLDVPIDFVKKSLENQRDEPDKDYLNGKKDIHEADLDFQLRVREMYLKQVEEDKSFISISCEDKDGNMLAPEAIFAKIQECYDNHKKN